jgi:mannose-6-phosphate isomerase-like protein (cupin superfamily)
MSSFIEISPEEMLKRVAVFKRLQPSSLAVIDAVLPQFNRQFFSVIGRGIAEDPTMSVPIKDAEHFHLAIVKAAPGKGTGLHSHTTVEVFMPLSGRWSVQWGLQGGNELFLDQWDVISVPAQVMRGFRNESPEDAYLLAIQGGTHPDPIDWSDDVKKAAAEQGVATDAGGNLVKR